MNDINRVIEEIREKAVKAQAEEGLIEDWRPADFTGDDWQPLNAAFLALAANHVLEIADAYERTVADGAALRQAISSILPRFKAPTSAWESACNDEALLIARQLAPLLASPSPGQQLLEERDRLRAEREKLMNGLVEHQKHRDAWRRYAYGRGERPMDFLSGNMVEADRGPTEIDRLREQLEAAMKVLLPMHRGDVQHYIYEQLANCRSDHPELFEKEGQPDADGDCDGSKAGDQGD